MSNPEEVQPLITEPVTEPLIEPTTQPVVDASVPIPEGYVDDEKGKMNTIEFCVNLMKGIAGTGSLALPIAFSQVGIIPGIGLFALVCGMMILATYQLIKLNEEINELHPDEYKTIQTNNTYAELVYKALGNVGYWIYYVCSLITLYGSNIGSMVVMTDFLECIPFSHNKTMRRLIAQIILTVLCIILCLLKDPKMLVGISSLGLFAIIGAFLTMIIFGFVEYKFDFAMSDLWPKSIEGFLQEFGVIVYCMGFILFLLTQYKYLRRSCKEHVVRSTGISISLMAVIYSIVGILLAGLYKGVGVKENILNSLPEGSWIVIPVNLLMAITVIGGFPLWMEPVNETIEGHWGPCTKGKVFITNPVYIILRIVEIILISLIAWFVPQFNDILSVVGNFSDNITTFIFPALMHLYVFRKQNSCGLKFLDWFALIFSTILMVFVLTHSLSFLACSFKKEGTWRPVLEKLIKSQQQHTNQSSISIHPFPLYADLDLVICDVCHNPVSRQSMENHLLYCANHLMEDSNNMADALSKITKAQTKRLMEANTLQELGNELKKKCIVEKPELNPAEENTPKVIQHTNTYSPISNTISTPVSLTTSRFFQDFVGS